MFSEHDPFADSGEEGEYTLDDVEGVVLDLLDQGMIKGYIARQQKVVVLKREGHGFVAVEEARRWKTSAATAGGAGEGGEGEGLGIVGGKVKIGGGGAGGNGGGVVRLSGLKTIGS